MKKRPLISVVIALAPWREAEILSYLEKMEYPKKKYEVIIIKGLHVPDNRNKGVQQARGEIIAFLDDDAIIEPDFLKKVELFFKHYPSIDILGGPQLTPDTDQFFAKTSGYALANRFGAQSVYKRYARKSFTLDADPSYITGANLMVRKSLFKGLQFDRRIYPADDVNFITQAKNMGHKVAYAPDIYVYHRRRNSWKGLIKQIFDYGFARREILKETCRQPIFFVPSIFVLYVLFLPFLTIINVSLIIPLLLYLFFIIFISGFESVSHKNMQAFFLLPFIFITIHISYGLGMLTGILIKFVVARKEKNNER